MSASSTRAGRRVVRLQTLPGHRDCDLDRRKRAAATERARNRSLLNVAPSRLAPRLLGTALAAIRRSLRRAEARSEGDDRGCAHRGRPARRPGFVEGRAAAVSTVRLVLYAALGLSRLRAGAVPERKRLSLIASSTRLGESLMLHASNASDPESVRLSDAWSVGMPPRAVRRLCWSPFLRPRSGLDVRSQHCALPQLGLGRCVVDERSDGCVAFVACRSHVVSSPL